MPFILNICRRNANCKLPGMRFLVGISILVALFLAHARWQARFSSGRFRITFFDVGQGDSALLEFPKGSTLLIDAGRGFRSWDIGKRVLVRELGLRMILTLDGLLMTHPDQDHSFGLRGILLERKVKKFWLNGVFLKNPTRVLSERLKLAQEQGAEIKPLTKPTELDWDGVKARWIPFHVSQKANDNSLVTFFQHGLCTALLTGDIQKKGEEALLHQVQSIDLLKVAHHGSKTSSTLPFLLKARPKAAVLSAGYQNSYGHPHKVVTDRYKSLGIELFRTDFHGMTTFVSDGKTWKCQTTHGPCGEFRCGQASENAPSMLDNSHEISSSRRLNLKDPTP